jgi:hypothetical protein
MSDAARAAYLFQCSGEDLYAVSHDGTGANIPRSSCTQGWKLCEKFELGRDEPVPAPIMAETILNGIAAVPDRLPYPTRLTSSFRTATASWAAIFCSSGSPELRMISAWRSGATAP